MKPFALFAACLPGLESQLAAELQAIGIKEPEVEPGGCAFAGHRNAIYRANLELGVATRVTLHVGSFRVRSFPELIRKTAQLEWSRFLHDHEPFDVRATCRKSRLYHSGGVEERVALGILEKLEQTPNVTDDAPSEDWPTVRVRVEEDTCHIALDTSGVALFKRGYKLDVAKAPLREDLARALVVASGWNRKSVLIDPLCGAGTIVIEAALLGRGLAPGNLRSFAFERTPILDEDAWKAIRDAARERALTELPGKLYGSDRDAGAIESAQANAQRAGVATDCEFANCALSDAPFLSGEPSAPTDGAVVTNPPYGNRVGNSDPRSLYQKLGGMIAPLPPTWRFAFVAASRRLALTTGARLDTAFLTDHGGAKVRAMVRATEAG